ncbi:MAG: DUF4230 domain-containing protein [Pseudomonadota bacterium]|nr:DUF4230 domain-containing protein [Pseudomonadota bacterium]
MVSDLKPAEGAHPSSIKVDPAMPATAQQPGIAAFDNGSLSAGAERLMWAAIAILAAAALFLGWRAYIYQEEGDPVASAMLAFEKQNSLVVFASRFEVVAESEYEQKVGPVVVRRVRQAAIIPASIDYRLDLSAMGTQSFSWDDTSETLTVTLPQLQTSRPNLDESKSRIFTEGLLNTGGSQQLLSEKNSEIAEEKAQAFAKNAEVLALARNSAKDAIRQNLAVPLQVAGFDDARVEVKFGGE